MEKETQLKTESPDNSEVEVDRAVELRAMAKMLRLAEGFTIAFAQCNQPAERRKLVSELRESLGDYSIAEVEFTEPIEHLLDELIPRLPDYKDADALFIYGLELSIQSDRKFSPVVANMNVSRNLFPRYISIPMILWLPGFAVTAILHGAPDFFSWRSAIFQFPSSPQGVALTSLYALSGDFQTIVNLTIDEKKEKIAVIEDLLTDYESLKPEQRDRRTEGDLLDRLAVLHYSLGDHDKARYFCQRGLEIKKEIGDKAGIAVSLHILATISEEQGDLEKAMNLYGQSFDIYQELDDKTGIAVCMNSLGIIASKQGDDSRAEDLFSRSLDILRELGDESRIAVRLNNLGYAANKRGDYTRAADFAMESLKISQERGNKTSLAVSLALLALLRDTQGNSNAAISLMATAHSFFNSIGSNRAIQTRTILDGFREKVSPEHFKMLLKEAQADPDKIIREVLESKENS